MGKGTDVLAALKAQPLTADELRARAATLASGGEVEATLDGKLIKRVSPTATPRVVAQQPSATWD